MGNLRISRGGGVGGISCNLLIKFKNFVLPLPHGAKMPIVDGVSKSELRISAFVILSAYF